MEDSSCITIVVTGSDLSELTKEAGGHRIQRIPENERKGRVHSSTVTVAVISQEAENTLELHDKDLKIEWFSGTGCGGQHRNKHQNSARVTHLPTGEVATAQTRSRQSSLKLAKDDLLARLDALSKSKKVSELSSLRTSQMGSGMRGDKIRTYRSQDNSAKDHRTGKSAQLSKILAGNFHLLW